MSEVSRSLKISIKTLSNWVTRARNGKIAPPPLIHQFYAASGITILLKTVLQTRLGSVGLMSL